MPAGGAGKRPPLYLAAEADQVLDRVAVGDLGHVLVDYGSRVELFGDVVGARADGLHAPLVCPTVGVSTGEGRQEGVVYVDDPVRISFDELWRKYLHVAGQHHQVDAVPDG